MALIRLEDFDPHYRNQLGADIQSFEVYTIANEKVGRVVDAWVNEMGRIQHFIVDLNSRTGVQRIMLPSEQAQLDRKNRRVYASRLSETDAHHLGIYETPAEVHPAREPLREPAREVVREPIQQPLQETVDETVRPIYRMASVEESAPLESPRVRRIRVPVESIEAMQAPVERATPLEGPRVQGGVTHSTTQSYVQPPVREQVPPPVHPPVSTNVVNEVPPVREQVPPPVNPPASMNVAAYPVDTSPGQPTTPLYGIGDRVEPAAEYPRVVDEQTIPLREERLIVENRKRKVGEVVVRKEIETEIIEVPIQREKLVVEQVGDNPRPLAEIDLRDETQPQSIDLNDPNVRRVRRSPNPPQQQPNQPL